MPRFEEDKYREEVLSVFLDTELYPKVSRDFERTSSKSEQKTGHDVTISFNWLSEPVITDEKAQNSDKWINNPSPTFVMEIFGESWLSDGEPDWNIGWFVDSTNKTEYYVLVWLPAVSLFKLESGIGDYPYLTYRPAEGVNFEPTTIAENTQSEIRFTKEELGTETEYRFVLSPDVIRGFESIEEPLPEILTTDQEADFGEWYYDPVHIHEAKVAVVEKKKIKEKLMEDGLTRDRLIKMGSEAVLYNKVEVSSEKVKSIKRSSGKQSGSANDEDPVVLIVKYETYGEIADQTYHYKDGQWDVGVQLF